MSKYHDDRSRASNPGGVSLSNLKLARFKSELSFIMKLVIGIWYPAEMLDEHLRLGDSRAAVVLIVNKKLVIAAYTDELDCVALLEFPHYLVQEYRLIVGSRLLTVNTYSAEPTLAEDLENGKDSYHRYTNFYPLIAEFLSDDLKKIEDRKAEIDEKEWDKALEMGKKKLNQSGIALRNGNPYRSSYPA